MAAVWVVVAILMIGTVVALVAAPQVLSDDVEPTVREFAEFRDAISRQVAGVRTDTRNTRQHAERPEASRLGEPDAKTT